MLDNEKSSSLKLIRAKDINHHFIKRDDHAKVDKLFKDFKMVYFIPVLLFLSLNVFLVCCLLASLILLENWYIDSIFFVGSLICYFVLKNYYITYKSVMPIRLHNCEYGKVYYKYIPSIRETKNRTLLNVLRFPKMIDVEFKSYFDKSEGKVTTKNCLLEGVLSYNCSFKDGDDVLVLCLTDGKCYALKVDK